MSIRHITKKLKLGKLGKIRDAPIWASIRKFGLKRVRTRRIHTYIETNWRRKKFKV